MKILLSLVVAAALVGCAGAPNGFTQTANSDYNASTVGNIQAGCPIPVSSTNRNLLCYAN